MAYVTNAERFGIEKGRRQGIEMSTLEIAKRMLDEGYELASINKVTGLPLARLESLQQEVEKSET